MRPAPGPDEIFIPYSNQEVYNPKRKMRGGITTSQRVRAWLRKHTPKQHKRTVVMSTDGYHPAIGEHWSFPDPKVSMMFKLTFGGL